MRRRDFVALLSALATTAYRSGERDLAKKAWEELARMFPAEPEYLLDLANLAADTADEPLARNTLDRLRQIDHADNLLERLDSERAAGSGLMEIAEASLWKVR